MALPASPKSSHDHCSLGDREPWRHTRHLRGALPEATGGVTLRFGLYDGPLTFTLTPDEAHELLQQIRYQLAAGATPELWHLDRSE